MLFRGKVYSDYEYATGNTKYGGSELDVAVGIARTAKGKTQWICVCS